MASRHSTVRSDKIEYALQLVFSVDGGVRLSRGAAALRPSERAMQLVVTLPRSLFRTPSLRAVVTVGEDNVTDRINLKLDAASDALRAALGCDVVLEIKSEETK